MDKEIIIMFRVDMWGNDNCMYSADGQGHHLTFPVCALGPKVIILIKFMYFFDIWPFYALDVSIWKQIATWFIGISIILDLNIVLIATVITVHTTKSNVFITFSKQVCTMCSENDSTLGRPRSENAKMSWVWLFYTVIRFMVEYIMPPNFRP